MRTSKELWSSDLLNKFCLENFVLYKMNHFKWCTSRWQDFRRRIGKIKKWCHSKHLNWNTPGIIWISKWSQIKHRKFLAIRCQWQPATIQAIQWIVFTKCNSLLSARSKIVALAVHSKSLRIDKNWSQRTVSPKIFIEYAAFFCWSLDGPLQEPTKLLNI